MVYAFHPTTFFQLGVFIINKCGWKNLEKNENAVSESRLKYRQSQDAEREDDGEYCEES